jgi:hypothetical protein
MTFTTGIFDSARTLRAVCVLSMLASLMTSFAVAAQQPAAAVSAPAPALSPSKSSNTASLANKPDTKPLWTELTPIQQQVLSPLAQEWNKLDTNHKSKWLVISNKYAPKYAAMTPEQQQRLQENIRSLATMTPEQRRLARESYARAKKLAPEQKTAKWEQYQQLPEEQKQKLAADATAKKHIANLPSLQNKAKTVEPLNASTVAKKPLTNHNTVQTNGNHVTPPAPVNQAQTPITSATAAPTASASTPAPTAAPVPPATSK